MNTTVKQMGPTRDTDIETSESESNQAILTPMNFRESSKKGNMVETPSQSEVKKLKFKKRKKS